MRVRLGVLAVVTLTLGGLLALACADEETAPGVPSAQPGTEARDFREFAGLIARAAAEGDVGFFASRVQPEPYTCSEQEVTEGALGGAEAGLCERAGQRLDLVFLGFWQSEGLYTTPERLAREIEDRLVGDVSLYATARSPSAFYQGRSLYTAILTAGIAIDFEYVGRRWVIRGMSFGGPQELLDPDTTPYSEWERY